MAAPRYLPSDSTLAKWRDEGLTHAQIADRVYAETGYRVSRSTVSAALSRAGLTSRVRYSDWLPWKRIATEHNGHYAAQMLRAGARIEAGEETSEALRSRYQNWKTRMDAEDACVHYDPDTVDGFYYVRRRPGIDGLVRKIDIP